MKILRPAIWCVFPFDGLEEEKKSLKTLCITAEEGRFLMLQIANQVK